MGSLRRWFRSAALAVCLLTPLAAASEPANFVRFGDVDLVATQPFVLVPVQVTNAKPLRKFSLGIDYDDDLLELLTIEAGETEWGAWIYELDRYWRDGYIWIELEYARPLPPSEGATVLHLLFRLADGVVSPEGWPALETTVGAAPASVGRPLFKLEESNFQQTYVQPLPAPGRVTVYTRDAIELEGAVATPDSGPVAVLVFLSHLYPGSVLHMGLDYDDDILGIRDVRPGEALKGMGEAEIGWYVDGGRLHVDLNLGRRTLQAGCRQAVLEIWVEVDPARIESPGRASIEVATDEGTSFQFRPIAYAKGAVVETQPRNFIRGDSNLDGSVDLEDAVAILQILFDGVDVRCQKAADVDDSGAITVGDVVLILNHLFGDGKPPAPPYPTAGPDTTPDGLRCP